MAPETEKYVRDVHCSRCGKGVSGFDPELGLVVRAFVQCPECLEGDQQDRNALQGWQPIETLTAKQTEPFIAWFPGSGGIYSQADMMSGWAEYQEILGFGETPATHWLPVYPPAAPRSVVAPEE